MPETHDAVTHVRGTSDGAPFATALAFGRHQMTADEPHALGGANAGPPPFAYLLSGLVACTCITLRMYAARKAWPLTGITVDADYHHVPDGAFIERVLHFAGDLSDEQRARLADIAERTPVTLALKAGSDIRTRLGD
ncbi:MAG: OsmC family protein [Proteobacteria bacterium]|nr:OsmC family protein [Pseudomonadota bacterium]